jgi:DNA repair protein RadC
MLPREKYLERGIDNLSDMELIAILVGSGIKGHNFLSVSKSVVSRVRNVVREKGDIHINDILDINGVGLATAMRILCGIELGRRLYDLNPKERFVFKFSRGFFCFAKGVCKKEAEYIIGLSLNSRFELVRTKNSIHWYCR